LNENEKKVDDDDGFFFVENPVAQPKERANKKSAPGYHGYAFGFFPHPDISELGYISQKRKCSEHIDAFIDKCA